MSDSLESSMWLLGFKSGSNARAASVQLLNCLQALITFFFFFLVFEMVSLCIHGCPGNSYVNKTRLEHRDSVSAFQVQELWVCHHSWD